MAGENVLIARYNTDILTTEIHKPLPQQQTAKMSSDSEQPAAKRQKKNDDDAQLTSRVLS